MQSSCHHPLSVHLAAKLVEVPCGDVFVCMWWLSMQRSRHTHGFVLVFQLRCESVCVAMVAGGAGECMHGVLVVVSLADSSVTIVRLSSHPALPSHARRSVQIGSQLELFDVGDEILPDVTAALSAPWHTPGSVVFRIGDRGDKALYCLGDAAAHEVTSIENPYFSSAFETDRAAATANRTALLDTLADEAALVVTSHSTFPPAGRLRRHGDGAVAHDGCCFRGTPQECTLRPACTRCWQ